MNKKNPSREESPQGKKDSRVYEKPLFEETEGMTFAEEIIQKFNGGRFCLQCSACHGCW